MQHIYRLLLCFLFTFLLFNTQSMGAPATPDWLFSDHQLLHQGKAVNLHVLHVRADNKQFANKQDFSDGSFEKPFTEIETAIHTANKINKKNLLIYIWAGTYYPQEVIRVTVPGLTIAGAGKALQLDNKLALPPQTQQEVIWLTDETPLIDSTLKISTPGGTEQNSQKKELIFTAVFAENDLYVSGINFAGREEERGYEIKAPTAITMKKGLLEINQCTFQRFNVAISSNADVLIKKNNTFSDLRYGVMITKDAPGNITIHDDNRFENITEKSIYIPFGLVKIGNQNRFIGTTRENIFAGNIVIGNNNTITSEKHALYANQTMRIGSGNIINGQVKAYGNTTIGNNNQFTNTVIEVRHWSSKQEKEELTLSFGNNNSIKGSPEGDCLICVGLAILGNENQVYECGLSNTSSGYSGIRANQITLGNNNTIYGNRRGGLELNGDLKMGTGNIIRDNEEWGISLSATGGRTTQATFGGDNLLENNGFAWEKICDLSMFSADGIIINAQPTDKLGTYCKHS